MSFKQTDIRQIRKNAVEMIGDEWALVNSFADGVVNTMTVSWGGMGELWGKDVVFIFIRPQRYTYELLEKSDMFSMSFFGGDFKEELTVCGRVSGRDTDKFSRTGLTVTELDGVPCVEQAKVNIVCRKIAFQDMKPDGFLDAGIASNYAVGDYHRIYVGEIVKVYTEE